MSGGPYRSSEVVDVAPPRKWKRLVCWCVGHDWKCLRISSPRAIYQYHPLAGIDAVCRRCSKEWLDARPPQVVYDGLPLVIKTRIIVEQQDGTKEVFE